MYFFPWCLFRRFINLNSFSSCSGEKDNTEKWLYKLDSEDQAICSWQRDFFHASKIMLSAEFMLASVRGPAKNAEFQGRRSRVREQHGLHRMATMQRKGILLNIRQAKCFLNLFFSYSLDSKLFYICFRCTIEWVESRILYRAVLPMFQVLTWSYT